MQPSDFKHQRAIIRANGTVEPIDRVSTMADVDAALGGALPTTVNLRDGRVMLCADDGYARGLPVNQLATELYWSVCRPGTTHRILGDVLVTVDADFAGDGSDGESFGG